MPWTYLHTLQSCYPSNHLTVLIVNTANSIKRNKGLKVMINERGSIWVAMEAILLLLYTWNSIPTPGTDFSHCFFTLGWEFQFPINFSSNKHWELTSASVTIQSFSRELAQHLQALHKVASILVEEQQAMHYEFINAHWPDPKIYLVGDIVFACQALRSNASWGKVDKLAYPFTEPWRITAKLHGASYNIKHCSTKKTEKWHALDLSPYPAELLPLQPLDGSDSQYGQLHKKISKNPYIQAGIKGFEPPTPFKISAQYLTIDKGLDFSWPTLAKLNEDLFPYPWSFGKEFDAHLIGNAATPSPGFYTGPPPLAPEYSSPTMPPATILAQQIIASSDNLSFISNSIGSGDAWEWPLLRVAFDATMSLYPSCLVDGHYLQDFYLPHPSDFRFNATNRQFWLQYCSHDDIVGPTNSMYTHYIWPSETSEAYAN